MNLIKPFKRFYYSFLRSYSRFLGDRPADFVYQYLCSLKFWADHRYWPHIKKPHSFSEKIFHRMLFDRNPQWTRLSDKLRVRDFVESRVGSRVLIPLLWCGDTSEEIPFDELPDKFVIKANHGCGYNIIISDKRRFDRNDTRQRLDAWLSKNFTYSTFMGMAWAYKNIKPRILIESFLDENGKVPNDYKFFCFSGRSEYVQVSIDRFGNASEQILDRDFNLMNVYNGVDLFQGKIECPQNYADLVLLADSLAEGFDFIRVDLYSINQRIYFGELTCYPAAGLARFVPKKYDYLFGEKWKNRSHSSAMSNDDSSFGAI